MSYCFASYILTVKSVFDQLVIIVVPAVELSDLLAYLLRRMLGGQLSHGLKVNLTPSG